MEEKEMEIEAIIRLEWKQFQGVHNEGGRASCQDDPKTFEIMRKSQFLTWDLEALESYHEDLKKAEEQKWNLMTEKYARMMESTVPEQFAGFAKTLPARGKERIKLQEAIISQEMKWAEEFLERYPKIGTRGRKIRTQEDTPWDTSMETYLRGELGTYSDRTLDLYYKMICRLKKEGKNLTELNLFYMAKLSGYQSLEQAEAALTEGMP